MSNNTAEVNVADIITAGGATALTFAALSAVILGWIVQRLFAGENVWARLFAFVLVFLFVGSVYYTQIQPKSEERKNDDLASGNASSSDPPAVGLPPSAGEPGGPRVQPEPSPDRPLPATPVQQPVQPENPLATVPLQKLQSNSDKAYDDGQFSRAFTLNSEGCRRNAAISCRWNGYLKENAMGFAKNIDHALTWYRKGCNLGDDASCERVQALSQPS